MRMLSVEMAAPMATDATDGMAGRDPDPPEDEYLDGFPWMSSDAGMLS